MTDKPEYILCAAIWYKEQETPLHRPKNIDKGVVVCGKGHAHCIGVFITLTGKRSVTVESGEYEQGFLTSHNRFVDRKEGMIIARQARQIKNEIEISERLELYSEDY